MQRPEHSNVMAPRPIPLRKLNEAILQLGEMKDGMNLRTTQKSVDRVGMRPSLSYRMNFSTTQKSVVGDWIEDYLRSEEARIQRQQQLVEKELNEAILQLGEMKDWMNLRTTQKSVDRVGMRPSLRSEEDRMQWQQQLVENKLREAARMQQELVEMKDRMNLRTTQKSVDRVGMRPSLRSDGIRIKYQAERYCIRSEEARMHQQLVEMSREAILQLVEKKLREAARMHQLAEMDDWWYLPTTQKSDDGGWIEDYLRSRKARMQQQLQLVEKELSKAILQLVEMNDQMNLSTTQKSVYGGWMRPSLRSRKARMQQQLVDKNLREAARLQQQLVKMESREASMQQQLVEKKLREAVRMHQLVEMDDRMNLSTTQKSVDGGWMSSFLSPELQRPDNSKVMEPRERNGSGVRIKHQSMEDLITFKEEQPPPWDWMNLLTTLQSVVGGGM